jgi:ubiquinone/menaquinone biosynthesis C-methylase UbiE
MGSITQKLKPLKDKFGYKQDNVRDKLSFKYLKDCDKILDVACGVGRFVSLAPEQIMGIDHNEESVKTCKEKGLNVIQGNALDLPFEDESFDAVHSAHVIEHLQPNDAYTYLKEINRVVKVGGIVCIKAPLLHWRFYNDLTHVRPYNPQAILHYLRTRKNVQRTKEGIPGLYEKIALHYRRPQVWASAYDTESKFWPFGVLFNFLRRFGIMSPKRTGFMLILRKISK